MEKSDSEQPQFRFLGGYTYSAKNRPKFWRAQTPLRIPDNSGFGPPFLENLRLSDFLDIEDFEVVLEEMVDTDMGYHVRFFSRTMEFLAGFPWWDHAEQMLAKCDFSLPLGSKAYPFHDCEQGWEIVVFQEDGFVYVMEGDFDGDGNYYSWFKVAETRYRSQWHEAVKKLID